MMELLTAIYAPLILGAAALALKMEATRRQGSPDWILWLSLTSSLTAVAMGLLAWEERSPLLAFVTALLVILGTLFWVLQAAYVAFTLNRPMASLASIVAALLSPLLAVLGVFFLLWEAFWLVMARLAGVSVGEEGD